MRCIKSPEKWKEPHYPNSHVVVNLHMEIPSSTSSPPTASAANAALTALSSSIQALGRGFDVTSDTRLLYCKGASGSRLVHVDEGNTRDLAISNGLVVPNVSADVEVSRGKVERETTSVCSFHEVGDDLFRIFDAGLLVFFIVC